MKRSTILLIALLIILAIITVFLLPSEKEREVSYKPPLISMKIDSASVVKIEIQRAGKPITMENVGGKWTITSPILYPADPVSVFQLVGGFSNFKVGSLISSNPEKQHLFQVDSSGTRITFTDRAGKTVSVVVGKMGPSFSEVYFRLPDSKDVYLGEGIDSWSVTKNLKDWRDKSILLTSSEVIMGLSYTTGPRAFTFIRDSSGWKSGEKHIETGDLNSTLNMLSNLRADDFIDSITEIKSRPIMIDVKATENVTLNLYPSLPDSARYFVRSSKSPQMFTISKWTAQQLLKPIEKFTASAVRAQQVASEEKKEEKKLVEPKPTPPVVTQKEEKKTPPPVTETKKAQTEEIKKPTSPTEPKKQVESPNKESKVAAPPQKVPQPPSKNQQKVTEDEGDLNVHTVQKGETMTTIAKKYNVTVEQILKWNLLKSIAVKPGQELYIYVRK